MLLEKLTVTLFYCFGNAIKLCHHVKSTHPGKSNIFTFYPSRKDCPYNMPARVPGRTRLTSANQCKGAVISENKTTVITSSIARPPGALRSGLRFPPNTNRGRDVDACTWTWAVAGCRHRDPIHHDAAQLWCELSVALVCRLLCSTSTRGRIFRLLVQIACFFLSRWQIHTLLYIQKKSKKLITESSCQVHNSLWS